MLILVLLGMYFDALVVFVTSQTLFFRLALAILCVKRKNLHIVDIFINTYLPCLANVVFECPLGPNHSIGLLVKTFDTK